MIDYLSLFSLKGKTAFVVGGAGLIGSEVSKALASAGARTVILDSNEKKGRSLAKEISKNSFKADYGCFDAADLENAEAKMSDLAKKYGSIDIWVNAAYPRTDDWSDPPEKLNIRSWRKNIDMHLNSYSWISRAAALEMKKTGRKGVIINFGSTYGVVGSDFTVYEGTGMTSPMAYSAIKGGIINLTRYMASYFGRHGIRVNNICPGGVFDDQKKRFVKNYEKKVPLGKMARPDQIASAVLFLASDASSYVNGATIMVDGGWTAI